MLQQNNRILCGQCYTHAPSHAHTHTLTQHGQEADTDGKQGAEAEAYILPIDGQSHLTVTPPVVHGTLAGELRG